MMRLLSFSVFAVSVTMAQTVGLPEYGVQLTGTVLSPVVVNNSSHRILAFTLQWEESGVRSQPEATSFMGQLRSRQGAGIGPGESFGKDTAPIRPEVRNAVGEPPHAYATKVWLDSALFDNGLLVGPDLGNTFDYLTLSVQAELTVHSLLLSAADKTSRDAAWRKIGEIAATRPNPPRDPVAGRAQFRAALVAYNSAQELLRVRDRTGEAAAIALAASTQAYPKIRKE